MDHGFPYAVTLRRQPSAGEAKQTKNTDSQHAMLQKRRRKMRNDTRRVERLGSPVLQL
jgi:hypothetical protein